MNIKNNKKNTGRFVIIGAAAVLVIIVLAAMFSVQKNAGSKKKTYATILPQIGDITASITETGSLAPQNRLQIKPPVAGRIDKILVVEGQYVSAGQTIAIMSAGDRVTLLDAARAKGAAVLKEWEEIYKAIPIVAPMNGQIIVKAVQPGQTVSLSDNIVVISDRLIVKCQIDETDIGKVKLDQRAFITLDAYPDTKVEGRVDHIYFESQTVNNVTIYNVDIAPSRVPDFFRSGMSANIDIVYESKHNVLMLPLSAVKSDGNDRYVLVSRGKGRTPDKVMVQTGIADDTSIEILSGITENDIVMIERGSYTLKSAEQSVNPFMPTPPRGAGRR